jgi:hypothetical protein
MEYRIKKVGDDWSFLPEKEWKEKLDYERLFNKVTRREKRIQKIIDELPKLKKELREWKKDRTKQYKQLIKYHKKFTPDISISLSKNPKKKEPSWRDSSYETRGNLSWTIYVTIQGKRKPIYLGTVRNVNEKLDLIKGKSYYKDLVPHERYKHQEIITREIEKLVYPLIKEEMLSILTNEGSLDSFLNRTIKGREYLDELYKNSEYYEEPKPKKPKPKGKRMNVFRPPPSYWIKKKKEESKK